MQIYFGIVENRNDPLELGRSQVRVVGLHTHDKNLLPTADLPWCAMMQPTISAAMNGIGYTPIGPVEGTSVIVTYLDDSMQQGVIMGSVGGIATEPVPIDFDDSGPISTSEKVDDVIALRSVKGPTVGNKLKFYDPNSNRTDLTKKVKANMRVSGYGIEKGTTVVSVDSGTEITISSIVRDFGENIVEFAQPLANQNYIVQSKNTTTSAANADKADPVKKTPVNGEIPTLPPLPEYKNTQSKAAEGIKAIIAACDKVGLTSKEQKCALLGIAGGESGWIPTIESYNYSPARLKQVFSFATDADVEKYSNASKKGMSREEFFSWVYGPTTRGKSFLGNKTDEDGGKYYGRGFIQLTGYANYKKYSDMLKARGEPYDLVANPELLVDDINVSALVSALYLKDRIPSAVNPNAHPDYFYAAKKAVGYNTPDIAAKKLRYYEHFYGTSDGGGVVKDASSIIATNADPSGRPGPSKESIQTGSLGIGFRDPNNKYPLKDYIGESDVNRLARGIIKGTVVGIKDAKRIIGVPKGIVGGTWSQPLAPFGAKYPFNKVFETEGGHLQEFDDTPGQERIHTYHRSGTFTEIDTNGSQINYIVGDNYILMEQNGCIHVAGECNITVDGNTNIYARTDANIEVAQNATLKVGNNLDIGVATDVTMAVGGDYNLKVNGDFRIHSNTFSHKVNESHNVQATSYSAKSESINIHATGSANYLSDGETNMDYSAGNFGNGAEGGSDVEGVELTAPALGEPLNSFIKYSQAPERQFEEIAIIETPEDWNTPEGRFVTNNNKNTQGYSSDVSVSAGESSTQMSGGNSNQTAVDKSLIATTKDFTNDYTLSKSITLGMMIAGGVNGKHKLTPQMLKPNANANERLYSVQEIVGNLADTAANVLENIIDVLPGGLSGYNSQWTITSGYRLKGVVKTESPSSDHCKGHCVDIALIHPDKMVKTYELIKQIEPLVPYDQLILEYRYPNSVWIHISYRRDNNRKMAFTMLNDKTYKRNAQGLPAGFYMLDNIPPST